jgi:hypothetical protein
MKWTLSPFPFGFSYATEGPYVQWIGPLVDLQALYKRGNIVWTEVGVIENILFLTRDRSQIVSYKESVANLICHFINWYSKYIV